MYYSDKPANIVSTNSMFILNEHFDGKVTQVGGTIDYPVVSNETFYDGRYNTYLYLKTFEQDNEGKYNGKNKYVKVVIKPDQKAFISQYKSGMDVNEIGEITHKQVTCYISIVRSNDFLMGLGNCCASSRNCSMFNQFYNCYFQQERGFYGDSAAQIMGNLDNYTIKDFNIEIVDDIDLHILYTASHYHS